MLPDWRPVFQTMDDIHGMQATVSPTRWLSWAQLPSVTGWPSVNTLSLGLALKFCLYKQHCCFHYQNFPLPQPLSPTHSPVTKRFYILLKDDCPTMLQIWTPQRAAMLIGSLLVKSRKKDGLWHLILLPQMLVLFIMSLIHTLWARNGSTRSHVLVTFKCQFLAHSQKLRRKKCCGSVF